MYYITLYSGGVPVGEWATSKYTFNGGRYSFVEENTKEIFTISGTVIIKEIPR